MLSHCPIASPGLQVSASQRDFKLLLDMNLPLILPTSPWPVQCPARSNAAETPDDRWACSWDALCLSCWDADPLVNYRTFLGGGAWTSVERWNLLKERRPDLILTGPRDKHSTSLLIICRVPKLMGFGRKKTHCLMVVERGRPTGSLA